MWFSYSTDQYCFYKCHVNSFRHQIFHFIQTPSIYEHLLWASYSTGCWVISNKNDFYISPGNRHTMKSWQFPKLVVKVNENNLHFSSYRKKGMNQEDMKKLGVSLLEQR